MSLYSLMINVLEILHLNSQLQSVCTSTVDIIRKWKKESFFVNNWEGSQSLEVKRLLFLSGMV